MIKELYYMTQYASYMTDNDYYISMWEQYQKLDKILLNMLVSELAPEVDDRYNMILFDLLYRIDNDDLKDLIKLWEHLKDNDIMGFLEAIDIDYNDLLNIDDYIYNYDTLEELADEDLKANGIKANGIRANALYWIDELDARYNYFVFNGYYNGFYCYDSISDALSDFIDFRDIKDVLIDYFNNVED